MERLYAQRGAWSVWRILRHPKIACGIIDESVMMMENLDKNLLIANKDLDEHRILCLKLTAERDALAATLKERDDELLKVRDDLERITMELEDARDELLTHRSVDAKLAEFNQQLVKVEEMKRKYERRISFMERMLRHADMSIDVEEDELAIEKDSRQVVRPKVTIDMTSNAPAPEEESKEASDKRKNKAEELRRIFQEKRAPGLPDTFPNPKSTDDWLLDLPEGL